MTSATVRHSIRLADGDAAYRVAAWQELMLTSGRVEVTPEEAERFVSESNWRRLGPVMIGRISASDFRLVRTEEAASRSGLDHVFINVFETGSGHGVCGRRSVVFDVGSLSVTKLSSAADYHLKGITFTVLVMPRRLMETAVGPVDSLDGRVFKGSTPEAVIIGAHIRALLDLPEALPQAKAALAGRTCLSLLSACFSKPTPRAAIGIDPDAELAKTIRSYIEEHLADPDLGSVRICEQFGLSRSRLYRLMSASGDVAASIRRLRVLRAHREIASRRMMDRSMPEIAACFGFSQERSFRRVFHQTFGYTPAQLQGRVRTGASVSLPGSGAVVDDWFNGL